MALRGMVRWRTKRSRLRCTVRTPCCSALLTGTKRTEGRVTASQMASASAASFLPRFGLESGAMSTWLWTELKKKITLVTVGQQGPIVRFVTIGTECSHRLSSLGIPHQVSKRRSIGTTRIASLSTGLSPCFSSNPSDSVNTVCPKEASTLRH
jgi:hypothetical protein